MNTHHSNLHEYGLTSFTHWKDHINIKSDAVSCKLIIRECISCCSKIKKYSVFTWQDYVVSMNLQSYIKRNKKKNITMPHSPTDKERYGISMEVLKKHLLVWKKNFFVFANDLSGHWELHSYFENKSVSLLNWSILCSNGHRSDQLVQYHSS